MNTHRLTFAHYVKYQMVKQSRRGEMDAAPPTRSETPESQGHTGNRTPAISSLHRGSEHSIRALYPGPGWNQTN